MESTEIKNIRVRRGDKNAVACLLLERLQIGKPQKIQLFFICIFQFCAV